MVAPRTCNMIFCCTKANLSLLQRVKENDMKSIFRAGILASLVGAFGLAPTQALAAEELRLGMITPPSHVWTQAGQRFAKQLAEETNGEVTVQVFPGGQLGSETDML